VHIERAASHNVEDELIQIGAVGQRWYLVTLLGVNIYFAPTWPVIGSPVGTRPGGCIHVGVVSEDPPGKFRPPTVTRHVFSSKQFYPGQN
jgi:hypothetical protein